MWFKNFFKIVYPYRHSGTQFWSMCIVILIIAFFVCLTNAFTLSNFLPLPNLSHNVSSHFHLGTYSPSDNGMEWVSFCQFLVRLAMVLVLSLHVSFFAFVEQSDNKLAQYTKSLNWMTSWCHKISLKITEKIYKWHG